MPAPSYCNVGPQTEDEPHATKLYRLGFLGEAVEHGRVYVEDASGRLREVTTWRDEEGGRVVVCWGRKPQFGVCVETDVSTLVVDPNLP